MELLDSYKRAAVASHRSVLSLLTEAFRLRIAPKQLGLTEYIDFRLYENDLSWGTKLTYGGQRTQAAAEDLLIDDYSRFLSLDKVTMYALLAGFNLPIPSIRATYRSIRPSKHLQLRTKEDLALYLRNSKNLPVYLKKSFGSYGRGNALITSANEHQLTLGNGASESIDKFVDSLDDAHSLGWILQEPLTSHPYVEALTGSPKISGIRIHTFMGKKEPKVLKAIFKINAGLRDSDNFEHGTSGNMLAAVDIRFGRILRAIDGTGTHQVELAVNPKTGADILGFEVPNWADVVRLVLDAQRAFPGFLCPGWDIAICADGPRILEVNAFGDIDLSQHAYRESFFDDAFMACLRERELDSLLLQSSGKRRQSPVNNRIGVKKHHWLW